MVSVGDPGRSEGLNPTGPQGPREAGRTRSGRGRIERQDAVQRAAQLAEILALVQAQGDEVVGHQKLRRLRPDPKTYLGRGAAAEVAARARECNANLLTLDAELSPSQARNLEDVAGIAVCDREAVILNVFLRHARTARARIQVEIAQLEYLRPRIRGLGLDMDQQARVFIPYAATEAIDSAYAECRVLEADAVERGLVLTLEGEAHVVARLQRAAKKEVR